MSYEAALQKSWQALRRADKGKRQLQFLNHRLEIDPAAETIVSLSGEASFRDYHQVLILHYLEGEDRVSAPAEEKWISFKELPGGEIYYSAFHKRAVEPLLQKFGQQVRSIYEATSFLKAEKIDYGTAAAAIRVFPKIRLGIVLWEADEEFPAECSILFNEGVGEILPTEDIAVMAGITALAL